MNKDVFGMACGFFKAVNLILFLRSDWRLFIVYAVFCTGENNFYDTFFICFGLVLAGKSMKYFLVLFVAVPEPLYSGPDLVQLFNAVSLEVLI